MALGLMSLLAVERSLAFALESRRRARFAFDAVDRNSWVLNARIGAENAKFWVRQWRLEVAA